MCQKNSVMRATHVDFQHGRGGKALREQNAEARLHPSIEYALPKQSSPSIRHGTCLRTVPVLTWAAALAMSARKSASLLAHIRCRAAYHRRGRKPPCFFIGFAGNTAPRDPGKFSSCNELSLVQSHPSGPPPIASDEELSPMMRHFCTSE